MLCILETWKASCSPISLKCKKVGQKSYKPYSNERDYTIANSISSSPDAKISLPILSVSRHALWKEETRAQPQGDSVVDAS